VRERTAHLQVGLETLKGQLEMSQRDLDRHQTSNKEVEEMRAVEQKLLRDLQSSSFLIDQLNEDGITHRECLSLTC
jgi:hypothetical protein